MDECKFTSKVLGTVCKENFQSRHRHSNQSRSPVRETGGNSDIVTVFNEDTEMTDK